MGKGYDLHHGARIVRVTDGEKPYFFGYYDKHQWDASGRYVLALRPPFENQSPQANDEAVVGMVDLEDGYRFIELGTTRAWNWQQGAMLQWLAGEEQTIVYNDRVADRFVTVVQHVHSGKRRLLPRPVYTVSEDGRWALSLNFSRLARTRPGYGYNGLVDMGQDDPCPSEDGIFLMHMATGDHRLIVDIASLAEYEKLPGMDEAEHWVNHLLFNPSGERFVFLHRWRPYGEKRWTTRFYTADKQGDHRHLFPVNTASHFIWRDDDHILLWAQTENLGGGYYVLTDRTDEVQPIARRWMVQDGHCTYSPEGAWILTDAYPDQNRMRPLMLYNVARDENIRVGAFYSPPEPDVEFRCDLHPRWSRDGRFVSIDSVHEGSRQVYIIDVSPIVSEAS